MLWHSRRAAAEVDRGWLCSAGLSSHGCAPARGVEWGQGHGHVMQSMDTGMAGTQAAARRARPCLRSRGGRPHLGMHVHGSLLALLLRSVGQLAVGGCMGVRLCPQLLRLLLQPVLVLAAVQGCGSAAVSRTPSSAAMTMVRHPASTTWPSGSSSQPAGGGGCSHAAQRMQQTSACATQHSWKRLQGVPWVWRPCSWETCRLACWCACACALAAVEHCCALAWAAAWAWAWEMACTQPHGSAAGPNGQTGGQPGLPTRALTTPCAAGVAGMKHVAGCHRRAEDRRAWLCVRGAGEAAPCGRAGQEAQAARAGAAPDGAGDTHVGMQRLGLSSLLQAGRLGLVAVRLAHRLLLLARPCVRLLAAQHRTGRVCLRMQETHLPGQGSGTVGLRGGHCARPASVRRHVRDPCRRRGPFGA